MYHRDLAEQRADFFAQNLALENQTSFNAWTHIGINGSGADSVFAEFASSLFLDIPDFGSLNLTGFDVPGVPQAAAPGPSFNTIPGNTSTTETLAVDAQRIEVLDFVGDQDWFSVTLVAGQTYDISMLGTGSTPLSDPYVEIMSSTGVMLAENDDIELGNIRNSLLTYTAATSGTHYINAHAFSVETGTYTLSLSLGNENSGDLAASTATTGTAVINGSVGGTFDSTSDADWYAVTLTAGTRYKISVDDTNPGLTGNTFLEFYDSNGNLIESDDNDGVGLNAQIAYTVTQTGTYYLSADSVSTTGTYALTVKEVPILSEFTIDEVADFLIEGTHGRESYDISGSTTITYNIDALSAGAQALAIQALQAWADLTPLVFVPASVATAQIEFTDDLGSGGSQTAFNSNTYSGVGVISGGEIRVSSNWNGGNTTLDSYTYQTFIHEIGHALGLGHAGPYNASATYDVDNVYLNDSWAYTVMSYFDQTESSYFGDFRYVLAPNIADVIAIQDLYGVNTSTRGGDNVYGFNSTETDVHDFTQFTRAPSISIYDTGGTDTLDFSGYTEDQRIDLNVDTFSDVNGLAGVISIVRGTVIENAIGGSGIDTITGNDANNVLTGNAGNDILSSGKGNDTLDGGAGDDMLDGGSGSDTFIGGAGADTIIGGGGFDIVDYSASGSAVSLDLNTGGTLGDANGDTYSSIQRVNGTAFDDTMTGINSNKDVFYGGAGNDTLNGNSGADNLFGEGGADTLNGGGGNDKLTGAGGLDTLNGGAGVDLGFGGLGNDIFNGGDNVDKFFGEEGNDTAFGDAGKDVLFGDDGNDTLHGGADDDRVIGRNDDDTLYGDGGADKVKGGFGNDMLFGGDDNDSLFGNADTDVLDGGAGNDQLFGGLGDDTFVFNLSDGAASDRVNDFEISDTVQLNGFGFANAGAAAGSFVQFGSNVKFNSGGVEITFVNATLADVQAAVAVDGLAELPGEPKATTPIAEIMDTPNHLDAIADFLAMADPGRTQIYMNAKGYAEIMTEDDAGYDQFLLDVL